MKKKTTIELHRPDAADFANAPKLPLTVVLDNIRSEYNVGSIFRTADAFVVERIILCGITPAPPAVEIHKTALGAELVVDWSQCRTALDAVADLRSRGYTVLAVEQVHGSHSLGQYPVDPGRRYAVVLGNEVRGVDQDVVDACDACLEIPQRDTKHSLNVANTAAIVMWQFFSRLNPGV